MNNTSTYFEVGGIVLLLIITPIILVAPIVLSGLNTALMLLEPKKELVNIIYWCFWFHTPIYMFNIYLLPFITKKAKNYIINSNISKTIKANLLHNIVTPSFIIEFSVMFYSMFILSSVYITLFTDFGYAGYDINFHYTSLKISITLLILYFLYSFLNQTEQ